MTMAEGMHTAFSGRHPNIFYFPIFTELYRHLTEIAEVHYTPAVNAQAEPGLQIFMFLCFLVVSEIIYPGFIVKVLAQVLHVK